VPFGTDGNSSSGLDGGNQAWPAITLCNESNASGPSSEQTAQPLVVNRLFLPGESDERFGEDIRGDRGSSSKAMALWHHHADEKELERFEVHAANSIRRVAGYERAIESSFPDSGDHSGVVKS
jgi:hypothetical protein